MNCERTMPDSPIYWMLVHLQSTALLSFGCRSHLSSLGRALSFHRDQLNVNCERLVFSIYRSIFRDDGGGDGDGVLFFLVWNAYVDE